MQSSPPPPRLLITKKKQMNPTIRKQLEKVYVKIESGKEDCICLAVDEEHRFLWKDEPEAKMIDPDEAFWWGRVTMGCQFNSHEARQARLLGIAMMLTMPKDMINEQFKTEKK